MGEGHGDATTYYLQGFRSNRKAVAHRVAYLFLPIGPIQTTEKNQVSTNTKFNLLHLFRFELPFLPETLPLVMMSMDYNHDHYCLYFVAIHRSLLRYFIKGYEPSIWDIGG